MHASACPCFSSPRTLRRSALVAVALAALSGPTAAQKVMQPGAWEISTRITREPPGKPPMRMGEHRQTHCLSAKFLAGEPYLDPQRDTTRPSRQSECRTADYVREGDSARWTTQCRLGETGLLTARVHNRASADSLHLRVEQTFSQGSADPGARIVVESEGHYKGACEGPVDVWR